MKKLEQMIKEIVKERKSIVMNYVVKRFQAN